jgi:GTPase SAR1 family protein
MNLGHNRRAAPVGPSSSLTTDAAIEPLVPADVVPPGGGDDDDIPTNQPFKLRKPTATSGTSTRMSGENCQKSLDEQRPAGEAHREAPRPRNAAKVILVGAGAVGKTAIARMVCESRPTVRYHRTIGVQRYQLDVVVSRDPLHPRDSYLPQTPDAIQDVQLQIWDIAGDNDFATLRESYFGGVTAGILLFASDKRESHSSLRSLKAAADKEIRRQRGNIGDNIDWVIVQHKVDVLSEGHSEASFTNCPEPEQAPDAGEAMDPGCVSIAEGRQLAESLGLQLFQTTTSNPSSLRAPFEALASTIFYHRLAEAAKVNPSAAAPSNFEAVTAQPSTSGLRERLRENTSQLAAAGGDDDDDSFRLPRLDTLASPINQPFKLHKPAALGPERPKFKEIYKTEIYTFFCLALSIVIFVLTFYIILPAEGVQVDPINEVTHVTEEGMKKAAG